jgi:hypothetical protein
VGTKAIHDAAVRMAIDLGAPFRDDLVIDTAAADRVALLSNQTAALVGPLAQGSLATSPYIYPQPLMGRLDDPFFGLVPPIVSFPPWWRRTGSPELANARLTADGSSAAAATPQIGPGRPGVDRGGSQPVDVAPAIGQVQIRIDPLGQVFLSGVVASEEVRREIEETARSVPGVTRVESQFQVQPRRAPEELPPPPPQPGLVPDSTGPDAPPALLPARSSRRNPGPITPTALDSAGLTRRVVAAIGRDPTAAAMPIRVRSSQGAVTLTGTVPSAYEAMTVYRAAQQTPGVNQIIDQLEFPVPDENHPNPLVSRAKPEDLEPYLAAQIRRHLGDLAHLDRIQAHGNRLELRGTLQDRADHERVLAIVRSMPLLTGFRIEPVFTSD